MINNLPVSIKLREYIFGLISKILSSKPSPVVFCFHSVTNNDWLFNIDPKNFELLVKELVKTRRIVGLRQMLNNVEVNDNVSITFDDGYEDVFTNAYPILKKYKTTACVFVNGIPDKKGNFGYLDGRKLLNLKHIRKLKKAGWDIGYHTKTHPDLRKLDRNKLEEEIIKAKNNLEKSIGFKIDYFAYPHGAYNKKVTQVVRNAGFKYAFTADGGGVNLKKMRFEVSRVLLDKYTKCEDLAVLTSSFGLKVNKFIIAILRIKDDLI